MFEEPSDIFRQYIWIPDKGLSEAEYLEFVHAVGNSNKAIERFLAGEVTDDEFLDLVRYAKRDAKGVSPLLFVY